MKHFASLSGDPINGIMPVGFAEHKAETNEGEVEVRLRQVSLPEGTELEVWLDGFVAGVTIVDRDGESRMRWKGEDGDFVPDVEVGSVIRIMDGFSTVLEGVFQLRDESGSSGPGLESSTRSQTSTFDANVSGSGTKGSALASSAIGSFRLALGKGGTSATVTGDTAGLSTSRTRIWIESDMGDSSKLYDLSGGPASKSGTFAAKIELGAAGIGELRAGAWYLVISSDSIPGGEARGRFMPSADRAPAGDDGKVSSFIGDYDGDGIADRAEFSGATGQGVWTVLRSSDGGKTIRNLGTFSDIPLSGDFDGDGILDLAVFNPETGTWLVDGSKVGSRIDVTLGSYGDVPLSADFDGDGLDDKAVYRPSTGEWLVLRSSDKTLATLTLWASDDPEQ